MRIEPSVLPASPAPSRGPRGGPAIAVPAPQPAQAQADAQQALQAANRALAEKGGELEFEFDDAAHRVIVKLIDTSTGEVIRQIPTKQMLAIAHALAQGHPIGSLVSGDA